MSNRLNDHFDYRRAEADLQEMGAHAPEEIYAYSSEKALRGFLMEHDLDPDRYFTGSQAESGGADSGNGGAGCYLTTACVAARGLPDQCPELTTLRAFRDGYLSGREGGLAEIERYYQTAPQLVRSIESRPDAGAIWDSVYDTLVAPCVRLIGQGRNEEALRLYRSRSLDLMDKYGTKEA